VRGHPSGLAGGIAEAVEIGIEIDFEIVWRRPMRAVGDRTEDAAG